MAPTPPEPARRIAKGDRLVLLAIVVAALVAAIPGSHLLALWMPDGPAIIVSHAVGLAFFALAVWRWRVSRMPMPPGEGAV